MVGRIPDLKYKPLNMEQSPCRYVLSMPANNHG